MTTITIAKNINWLPFFQVTIVATIIVIIMVVWNRRLRKEIKARQRAETSLQLAKLTMDSIPLHIFWFNNDFQISMANKAALEVVGVSLDELCTKSVWDLDPSFEREQSQRIWNKIKTQNSIDRQGLLRLNTGSLIPTEESLTYLNNIDGHPYVVSIGADITERKRQEKQLHDSKFKLKDALVKAEESSRLKSEFLSNMSHEIRTPLNAILGYSEMLDKGDVLGNQQQRYVQSIIKSGQALIALFNDILDLSKIEAGKMKIVPLAIDPKLFFGNIVEIFESKIRRKDLTLNLDLDPNLPQALLIDEIRLRQILFNIIGNAIKFTETGSITIAISFIQTSRTLGTITISIADTGIGIAKEDQQLIFQSFQQKSSGISRVYGGAGLGLSLSKRFVELMRGEILLESTVGKGSCFTIILPEVSIARTPAVPEKTITYNRAAIPEATILVADDIKTNRDLIEACLQDTPLTVLTAGNGEEAIQVVGTHKIDLILMDIRMDGMGGIEATTILRNDPKTASIPVIALSGADLDDVDLFDDFLKKPFSMQDIRNKIQQFLTKTVELKLQVTPAHPSSIDTGVSPLRETEKETLFKMITIARKTGNLAEYQALASLLQQYGQTYTNTILSNMGSTLSINTEQGAIIQIEDQLLELEKYLQELV